VGAAREPFLAATLSSIAGVVDDLVVNDNSGLAHSENVAAIQASWFAREGRLRIEQQPFVDFAQMRNAAQAMLSALKPRPDWVLFIDADEVHGAQLEQLARDVLPRLSERVAQLDAYTYHFWGTPRWMTDIARRMVFYRFSTELRWENRVHEKLCGLRGSTVVVPYIYHHYGNVLAPRDLAEKHQRYYRLGNPVPEPPSPENATLEMYIARAGKVRPFHGKHPVAANAALASLEHENALAAGTLDAAFRARRSPDVVLRTTLQAVNESLRVHLRHIEHPLLYRGPMVAR